MDAKRLKQIEEIYHAALDLSSDKRESFFKANCGEDDELRREIESLLAFEKTFGNFIDLPPESLAAEIFSATNANQYSLNTPYSQQSSLIKIPKSNFYPEFKWNKFINLILCFKSIHFL